MTTIHLTDAQRETFATCGLIVIDGEYGGLKMNAIQEPYYVAPEGWRIPTEPCDTCNGWAGQEMCDKGPYVCANPDCVGGLRVVTLTATCPKCGGGYCTEHLMCRQDAEAIERMHFCGACHGSGVVTLGRFTIPPLLPVVDWREGAWWREAFLAISSNPLEPPHLHDGKSTVPVALNPLPRPGQFITRPERVA